MYCTVEGLFSTVLAGDSAAPKAAESMSMSSGVLGQELEADKPLGK